MAVGTSALVGGQHVVIASYKVCNSQLFSRPSDSKVQGAKVALAAGCLRLSATHIGIQAAASITMGSNQSNIVPAVDRLPLEQLAHVLQYVPLKERLSSCALLHSSWRAAAAEATTEINSVCYNSSNSLSAWLQSHCSKVHVTKVSIHHSFRGLKGVFCRAQTIAVPLRLPVIHLQYLQYLELVDAPWESATVAGSGRQFKQSRRRQRTLSSLANLTALTNLVLSDRSVKLDGLEALTGLKHLRLSYSHAAGHVPGRRQVDTTQALLAAAVPKLPHLTRLSLTGEVCSSTALAQISIMQHLEHLMPQSLTQLWMVFGGGAPEVFMGSSADHLSQLTGLQELTLSGEGDLDATILAGMIKLRKVYLKFKRFAGADVQPLLVFSRLTALESLCLWCYGRVQETPAEAAALTTSSHLTHLRLDLGDTHNSLQEAHYEAMFPASRQLLRLQELRVGTALLSSTVDLGQLTGLKTLALLHCELDSQSDLDGGATFKLAAGLEKLTALKNLAGLVLSAPSVDLPAAVWSSLAALTGLRHLKVWCEPPSGQHLLALTSCQRLEELLISTPGFYGSMSLQDATGGPPEVWRMLPQEVLRVAQQQVAVLSAQTVVQADKLRAAKQVQEAAERGIRAMPVKRAPLKADAIVWQLLSLAAHSVGTALQLPSTPGRRDW